MLEYSLQYAYYYYTLTHAHIYYYSYEENGLHFGATTNPMNEFFIFKIYQIQIDSIFGTYIQYHNSHNNKNRSFE